MMGYEMVGVADQNSRTYKSQYGFYSKETGFVLNKTGLGLGKNELLDKMFHENCWELKKEPKKMTKEEIEKALGYEIEIDDGNDKKEIAESEEESNTKINSDKKENMDNRNTYIYGDGTYDPLGLFDALFGRR